MTQTFQIAVLFISKDLVQTLQEHSFKMFVTYLKILRELVVGVDGNWALNIVTSDFHFLSLKSQMCSVNSATGTVVIGQANLLKLSEAIPTSY